MLTSLNEFISPHLLALSIAIPLVCALLTAFLRGRAAQAAALAGFLAPLACALHAWYWFPENTAAFAYTAAHDIGLSSVGIKLSLGLNGISLPLYLLAAIVGLAAGLYALQSRIPGSAGFQPADGAAAPNKNSPSVYLSLLLIIHAGLLGAFASTDIFFLYFFHELALIPTFVLVNLYGGRDRSYASIKMAIYLTAGALVSLIGLIALQQTSGADTFNLIELHQHIHANGLLPSTQTHIAAILIIGLGALVSLWPLHTWAPLAYTAAPASVAMLHAGVLKKFGLYTLIQVVLPILPDGIRHWATPLALLAVLGNILFMGLSTIAQTNLKRMVSTSSVMHMGYAFLGIAAYNTLGAGAAILMMVAHGLTVALLFLLTTSLHERTQTLELDEMGGLARKLPALAALFTMAIFASIGLPGFAGFWGEILIFTAAWPFSKTLTVLATLGIIISAIYGLRALAKIFFGQPRQPAAASDIPDLRWTEKIPALILLIALLAIGIFPGLITQNLNNALPQNPPTAAGN